MAMDTPSDNIKRTQTRFVRLYPVRWTAEEILEEIIAHCGDSANDHCKSANEDQ